MTLLDLHPRAGIAALLEPEALALRFGEGVVVAETERRSSGALRPVLMQPERASDTEPLYAIYRGIAPSPAAGVEIARRGLVYAALVLRAGAIGDELARTRGHVNSPAPGTQIAYPEVHEIWHGQALLYLQNGTDAAAAADIVVIPLGAGEKAIVAPGWAGLLANVGGEPLVVGSWRSQDGVLRHDALAALGGMAHYMVKGGGSAGPDFVPNPRYGPDIPPPRPIAPRDLNDFGLTHGEPMLTSFRRSPDSLRFMLRPQDYADVWATLYRDV